MSSLVMLLLFTMSGIIQSKPAPGTYKLLSADLPKNGDRFKDALLAVSVDRSMNRAGVEALVCKVVADEKFSLKIDRLTILIFVGLDTAPPNLKSPSTDEETNPHQLAWYVWNPNLPRIRGRLVLMKDADGKKLDQWESREFSHEKGCR